MRDRITELDSYLAPIHVMKTAITIYTVMVNIYMLSIIERTPEMMGYLNILSSTTQMTMAEFIISCLVCGWVSWTILATKNIG